MSNQMQSEIAEISGQMDSIEDPRQCYALIQERIRRYRDEGRHVPEELARIERALMTECLAESQGR